MKTASEFQGLVSINQCQLTESSADSATDLNLSDTCAGAGICVLGCEVGLTVLWLGFRFFWWWDFCGFFFSYDLTIPSHSKKK